MKTFSRWAFRLLMIVLISVVSGIGLKDHAQTQVLHYPQLPEVDAPADLMWGSSVMGGCTLSTDKVQDPSDPVEPACTQAQLDSSCHIQCAMSALAWWLAGPSSHCFIYACVAGANGCSAGCTGTQGFLNTVPGSTAPPCIP